MSFTSTFGGIVSGISGWAKNVANKTKASFHQYPAGYGPAAHGASLVGYRSVRTGQFVSAGGLKSIPEAQRRYYVTVYGGYGNGGYQANPNNGGSPYNDGGH